MFLKVVLFCSQGLGRIYRQVKWKVYYLNKGNFMGLSNEISFILIFLAVFYLWIKTLDWNLPMRYNMSVSVIQVWTRFLVTFYGPGFLQQKLPNLRNEFTTTNLQLWTTFFYSLWSIQVNLSSRNIRFTTMDHNFGSMLVN